jgi:hypothetical protein
MFRKSDAAADIASRVMPQVGARVRRLALLAALGLTALGLAALAPSGASACGRLPAGAEASGPVLRGSTDTEGAQGAQVQPIINPHCSFTPSAGGAGAPAGSPDQAARALNQPTMPN